MKKSKLTFKEVVVASRPFWWINTAAGFFVGYLLATQKFSWALIIGTFYFLFPYNLFMYGVNDIFDYESDIKNPRKTGIDGSVLAKSKHKPLWLWIIATNIPFWVYFFITGSCMASTWFIIMIFMALAYSVKYLRLKEIPVIDSVTSAFHYTSPFLFGILLGNGQELWLPAFITYYIWVMSNHAFGAIQDITPDKQAGIGSIAVSFGAAKTINLVLAGYGVASLLPIVFYGLVGLPVAMLLSPYVYLVAKTLPQKKNDKASIFKRNWDKFLYVNYIVGFLLSVYFIVLVNF